ncbi:helix-turn-helix transcriptional regulator [Candidatus Sumerlaeota bacterium]|nr:helix-turn-helix transcriptional regulator [Candidatus Sumerlaeota bacterium]
MKSEIGASIAKSRANLGLTQDQFGRKYSVSGPAIFKFEKGYVRPSLELWLAMARDMSLSEQTSVLMWVRGKLPKKFQDFISLEPKTARESAAGYGKSQAEQRALKSDPAAARKAVLADRSAPRGLKELLKDADLWALYQPTGHEIHTLRTVFGSLGDGTKSAYREALRLVREFGSN